MLSHASVWLFPGGAEMPRTDHKGPLRLLLPLTLGEIRPRLMGFFGQGDDFIPPDLHPELAHNATKFFRRTFTRKGSLLRNFSGYELRLEKMYSKHLLQRVPESLEMDLSLCRADPSMVDIVFVTLSWFQRSGAVVKGLAKTRPEISDDLLPYFEEVKFSIHIEPALLGQKDLFKVPCAAVAYIGLETWLRPWFSKEQIERYGERFFFYSHWEVVTHAILSDDSYMAC